MEDRFSSLILFSICSRLSNHRFSKSQNVIIYICQTVKNSYLLKISPIRSLQYACNTHHLRNSHKHLWVARKTNRQCFADICKSRQSRFGSKSRIYGRIDSLKTINTAQRHLDNKYCLFSVLSLCCRTKPVWDQLGLCLSILFSFTFCLS